MLTFIAGTRPEFIKIRPVILECVKRKIAFQVICTGQHTDLLSGTGVRPTLNLHEASHNDPAEYVQRVYKRLKAQDTVRWGAILVQGDTASALAGARFGYESGITVGHIEAGLRSHDLNDPFPEEGFRTQIDRLSTYHFCPTEGNLLNLYLEGFGLGSEKRWVTGNTIVDALRLMRVRRDRKDFLLVTLHRRESFGEPLRMILRGLKAFATKFPDKAILFPVHPNPEVGKALQDVPMPLNVLLRNPAPHRDFLLTLGMAGGVLTDSGGVVEEAVTLGVPLVCVRNVTERPEAFPPGSLMMPSQCEERLCEALEVSLETNPEPSDVFGDGFASAKILDQLSRNCRITVS